jgi:flagellar biosynthesis protein FlhB
MSQENKTEKPTEQRRKKAREQGQVARSRELAGAVACAVTVWIFASAYSSAIRGWKGLLNNALTTAASVDAIAGLQLVQRTAWSAIAACSIPLLAMFGVAGLVLVGQGGFTFSPELIGLKPERLNPGSRMKQVFSMTTVSSLLKSLIPGAVIAAIVVQVLSREWPSVVGAAIGSGADVTGLIGGLLLEVGWKSTLVMVIWSGADYLLLRQKLESDLRMSKDEIREEMKQSEGNPATKGRIRKLQRQARRTRMMQAVETATVVITNPTHFAVALQYTADMPAPIVVAKGQNLLAQEIKKKAFWCGVPVIENPPVAQALYRGVEIGRGIPADLYAAVAEVLAFVFRLQHKSVRASKGEDRPK